MVGDIYSFKHSTSGFQLKLGTEGVVVQDMPDLWFPAGRLLFIIFANGEYEEFTSKQQLRCLSYIKHSPIHSGYIFKNMTQMKEDFSNGYWSTAFSN